MSNEKETSVEAKLAEVEKVLDEYNKSVGLNKIRYNAEVEKILELTQTELKALSEEELGAYAYNLAQYATFLQKEINRHNAKNKWANHNLNIMMGKHFNNYGDKYTKAEIKMAMIVNENEFAKALNKIVLETSLRIEELNFISTRILTQSNILQDLYKSKRSERYERRNERG